MALYVTVPPFLDPGIPIDILYKGICCSTYGICYSMYEWDDCENSYGLDRSPHFFYVLHQ